MRTKGYLLALGLLSGVAGLSGACGDETGTTSSTGTTTQSTTSSSGGDSTSGGVGTSSSGGTSTSSSGGTSTSSSGGTSSSGSGGLTCSDCTSGAQNAACKTQYDACMNNADCVKVYNCAWLNPGCSTNSDGACCTRKCITDSAVPQAASDMFLAFDKCVYCTTCKANCTDGSVDATGYCTNLDAANPVCP